MRAVIFELFETLVTEWIIPKYTLRECAAALDMNYSVFRRQWDALQTDRYMGKICGTLQAYKTILHNMNIGRNENTLIQSARMRDEYKNKCFSKIDAPIMTMLSELKKNNYKVGIISNCAVEEVSGLAESDLDRYLDTVVLSCDVEMMKPDVRMYQNCLNKLEVKAGDCYFVANEGSSDALIGAKNTGMIPIKVSWYIKEYKSDFTTRRIFPSFNDPNELTTYILEHESRQ